MLSTNLDVSRMLSIILEQVRASVEQDSFLVLDLGLFNLNSMDFVPVSAVYKSMVAGCCKLSVVVASF